MKMNKDDLKILEKTAVFAGFAALIFTLGWTWILSTMLCLLTIVGIGFIMLSSNDKMLKYFATTLVNKKQFDNALVASPERPAYWLTLFCLFFVTWCSAASSVPIAVAYFATVVVLRIVVLLNANRISDMIVDSTTFDEFHAKIKTVQQAWINYLSNNDSVDIDIKIINNAVKRMNHPSEKSLKRMKDVFEKNQ